MKTYPTTYKKDNKKAVIKFNEEWEEYQVWFYVEGSLLEKSTYYTADEEDAKLTACTWLDL